MIGDATQKPLIEVSEYYENQWKLQVYLLDKETKAPTQATTESAAYDLYSAEDVEFSDRDLKLVRTGIIAQPPQGYHLELLARSGLASKGLHLTNGVGLIDRDYAGPGDEIKLSFRWLRPPGAQEHFLKISKRDRIAQMILRKTYIFPIVVVNNPPGEKNRGGFGSTGIK